VEVGNLLLISDKEVGSETGGSNFGLGWGPQEDPRRILEYIKWSFVLVVLIRLLVTLTVGSGLFRRLYCSNLVFFIIRGFNFFAQHYSFEVFSKRSLV